MTSPGQTPTTALDGAEAELLPPQPVSRRMATLVYAGLAYPFVGLVLIRNLGLVPLYFHHIGNTEFGAWLATGGVMANLTVIDLGLIGVLVQQAAAAYGNRDRRRLERTLGTGFCVALILSCVIGAVGVAIAPWVVVPLKLDAGMAQRVVDSFRLVALATAFQLVVFATGGVLEALQRPLIPGILKVVGEAVSLGMTTWWVVHGWGLYGIAWGLVLRAAVMIGGNLIAYFWICWHVILIRLRVDWSLAITLGRLSVYQFGTQLASRFRMNFDPYIVGWILGPEVAGFYTVTLRAHETVRMLVAQFASAMIPSLAHLFGEGHLDRLRQVVALAFKFQALTIGIGMAGVIAFNEDFMRLWTGPERFAGQSVTVIAAVWMMAYLVGSVAYDTLFCMGRFQPLCRLAWAETILRIPLMIVLLMYVGMWGVPLASLVGQLVIGNWLTSMLLVKELGLSPSQVWAILGSVARLTALPLACAAACWMFLPHATSWGVLIAYGVGFSVIAGLLMLASDRGLLRLLRNRGRLEVAA